MELSTLLIIACLIFSLITLALLLISFFKRPKGFENLDAMSTETKKQNE